MMKAKAYTDTASTMPLPPIPPFSSSSSPLMAEADTTSSKKRVRQMGHSNWESPKIERERRSKMTQMFTQLRTTVPGVFPQATREVIINETIQYIKDLEKKKQRLEQIKESMKLTKEEEEEEGSRSKVPCSSNNMNCSVSVNVSSNVAFFGIQSLARPGFITLIFRVFFKHQAQILAANVSVHDGNLILAITANLVQNGADGNAAIENIKREIMAL